MWSNAAWRGRGRERRPRAPSGRRSGNARRTCPRFMAAAGIVGRSRRTASVLQRTVRCGRWTGGAGFDVHQPALVRLESHHRVQPVVAGFAVDHRMPDGEMFRCSGWRNGRNREKGRCQDGRLCNGARGARSLTFEGAGLCFSISCDAALLSPPVRCSCEQSRWSASLSRAKSVTSNIGAPGLTACGIGLVGAVFRLMVGRKELQWAMIVQERQPPTTQRPSVFTLPNGFGQSGTLLRHRLMPQSATSCT